MPHASSPFRREAEIGAGASERPFLGDLSRQPAPCTAPPSEQPRGRGDTGRGCCMRGLRTGPGGEPGPGRDLPASGHLQRAAVAVKAACEEGSGLKRT